MSEQQVKLAVKLYNARDFMRGYCGDFYQENVERYQGHIREAMEKWRLDELSAAMRLIEGLKKHSDTGIQQTLLLAAYVEMIEPSSNLGGVPS